MSLRRRSIAGLALVGGVLVSSAGTGCGDQRPPVTDGTSSRPATGGFDTDPSKDTRPPGCGTELDGTQCECLDAPLFIDAPTIYFVLDRSGSMAESDKWAQVRTVVGKIMRSLGPRARFGATMFPGTTNANTCAPGNEIMSVRDGDAPSSGVDGPTTRYLLSATLVQPFGGTPTGSTLEQVRARLTGVPGRRFIILATDGAPNCNPAASCNFDQCQANIANLQNCPAQGPPNYCDPQIGGFREDCNDAIRTTSAIATLKSVGIPTYVVGLPGAAAYGALLEQMATAGGTARPTSPRYFAVDSATESVMLATLKQIAAQIAGTCVFDLKEAPADPALVNVYVDNVILPFEPTNGWKIEGKAVTLLGAACDSVKAGDVLDVRIIVGCRRREIH